MHVEENWYIYLKDRELVCYDYLDTSLRYKILKRDQLHGLNVDASRYPKICSKDPLIKVNKNIQIGDVIAIYRDYEEGVSPYYFLRVVVKKI